MKTTLLEFARSRQLLLALALVPLFTLAEAGANDCGAAGEYAFVCGPKNAEDLLRVIACIEEPLLIAKILGHVQQREELNGSLARAPPGHQEQTFNLI